MWAIPKTFLRVKVSHLFNKRAFVSAVPRKAAKASQLPIGLIATAGCTAAVFSAYGCYAFMNNMSWSELWRHGLKEFERLNEASVELFDDTYERIFPPSGEPLLLELETLKFPDYVPTLVIDLNKTIIHMQYDHHEGWKVIKRPGADEFFKHLMHYYEIVVWSDDVFPVAQDVMNKWQIPVSGVLHRDQCKRRGGHFVKNIQLLGRNVSRVIQIDHDESAFGKNKQNGILIREFTGDPNDRELYDLIDFLKYAAATPPNEDIRKIIEEQGGGDPNIGRRYLVEKQAIDKKVEGRRNLSRSFGTLGKPSTTFNFNI
eukprot:Filipodium_phascolosomae@DN3050_c0_g1_i1.p1